MRLHSCHPQPPNKQPLCAPSSTPQPSQEDQPEKAAEHLRGFLQRFRVGEPPMTFPRAPPGTRPALPLVAGPVLAPAAAAGVAASQQPQLQP